MSQEEKLSYIQKTEYNYDSNPELVWAEIEAFIEEENDPNELDAWIYVLQNRGIDMEELAKRYFEAAEVAQEKLDEIVLD